ncbi:hypothetical protein ACI394_29140, partial [Klebsiella pneumoniae]|uniref:hypothetical protein n=1 Tax=Klebsiella pneumoniae TaxID=573 RepID=UPI0038535CA8
PASVAVPFPLSTNVTPEWSAPLDESEGLGYPFTVTVKVPATLVWSDVPVAEEKLGASLFVSVKLCDAGEPMLFVALIVTVKTPPVP